KGLISRDSQPSPLALLAATCSKIGTPGENQATGQQIIINPSQGLVQLQSQPQQLELVTTQLAGNAWQFVAASPVSKENNHSGSSVQYQVFPQIQTTEGHRIQINPANATALQDIQGQIQLIPAGNNQAIIATTNRTSSESIIAQNLANQTVPVQITPGVSIPLQLPIAGTQAQVVTSLPINIGGVTLALPVINIATGSSSGQVAQPTDSRLSNGNQLLSTPVTTASVSVMSDSPPSSTTTASTSLTGNEMLVTTAEAGQYARTANSSETSTEEAQMTKSETEVQNSSQLQSNAGVSNLSPSLGHIRR
uniref:Sp4 transcription factor n=1 Tax=Pseudonaja textilis TaxID=8673 RepID=A0A670ZSN3_PSETE